MGEQDLTVGECVLRMCLQAMQDGITDNDPGMIRAGLVGIEMLSADEPVFDKPSPEMWSP